MTTSSIHLSLNDKVSSGLIYFIVCSRGYSGAPDETFTADIWIPLEKAWTFDPEKHEEENSARVEQVKKDHLDLKELLENYLKRHPDIEELQKRLGQGVSSIQIDGHDEGCSYLIGRKITIKDLFQIILKNERTEYFQDELCSDSEWIPYATAIYRALVNNWDGRREKWSSVNGWRDVKCELMPMWQVKQCQELLDLTDQQVLTCSCAVLRESFITPSETYRGC